MSPAKALREGEALANEGALAATQPQWRPQSKSLAALCSKLSAEELEAMMDISPALAQLNVRRFAQYQDSFSEGDGASRRALWMFNGDAYEGLDAPSLPPGALAYLENSLRILSGLYGMLRPSALIRPYRLEMGRKVPGLGESLPAFWGPKICPEAIAQAGEGAEFVCLASEEYAKALEPWLRKAGKAVWQTRFESEKGGKRKVISFEAKRARGLLARHMALEQSAEFEQAARSFSAEGWALDGISGGAGAPCAVFVKR